MPTQHDRWILIELGLTLTFVVWYSLFVAHQLLAVVGIVVPLLFL